MSGWDETCGGGPEIEVPDVMGALRGLRVWKLDDDGHLTGISFPERWTPGENIARCLTFWKDMNDRTVALPVSSFYSSHAWRYDENGRIEPLPGFRVGLNCPGVARGNHGCGFYAKHGASAGRPGFQGAVRGIVEMYGQVELGPQGLRAEKARIVALVRPAALMRDLEEAKKRRQAVIDALNDLPLPPLWLYPFLLLPDLRAVWQTRVAAVSRARLALDAIDVVIDHIEGLLDPFKGDRHTRYDVPVYDDIRTMLSDWPVQDLTYLVEDVEQEETQ